MTAVPWLRQRMSVRCVPPISAALVLQQVLVAEPPGALDVDDAHALAAAARAGPGVTGVDAGRRRIEIDLPGRRSSAWRAAPPEATVAPSTAREAPKGA